MTNTGQRVDILNTERKSIPNTMILTEDRTKIKPAELDRIIMDYSEFKVVIVGPLNEIKHKFLINLNGNHVIRSQTVRYLLAAMAQC